MKKILKLFLCLTMALSLVSVVSTKEVKATTYYGSDVAAEAKKHVGQTYVWGGTGPSTFDCSGFVYYCYKQFGIKLSTSTSMYQNSNYVSYGGTKVSVSSLQPGDVICFGPNASKITHVGIYVGNGLMVNAANQKYNVCYMYISLDLYYKYGGAITGAVWNSSTGNVPLYGIRFLPSKGSNTGTSNSTPTIMNPQPNYLTGALESASISGNNVSVKGWAYDGDHIDCRIYMDVYLDGVKLGSKLTDTLRTDINTKYGLINKHGYDLSFSTSSTLSGTHNIKVYAMDFDSDDQILVGEKNVTVDSSTTTTPPIIYNPEPGVLKGNLESVNVTGNTLNVVGWAYDGDHIDCRIFMDVYLDDIKLGSLLTDTLRTDINNQFNLINKHGFDLTFTTDVVGKHTVKVYAMDFDSDDGVLVGSQEVTFGFANTAPTPTEQPNKTVVGNTDVISVNGDAITISGWFYDPDATDQSLEYNVYLNDQKVYSGTSNVYRSDVNNIHGLTGNHGFSASFKTTMPSDTYELSIFAKDANTGVEKCVGYKIVEVKQSTVLTFKDVSQSHWAYNYVGYIVARAIMSAPDGIFSPNQTMTRAMMVQTLYNLAGKPALTNHNATSKFTDVHSGDWFEDAVNWAYSVGVTKGYEGSNYFGPNDPMTREQMVTFLMNYGKIRGLDVTQTSDISGYYGASNISSWAVDNMKWAITVGLISGKDVVINGKNVKDLASQEYATRAQLAKVLTEYCKYYIV